MPATGPCPDPAQSSLCPHTLLPRYHFNSILPSILTSCQCSSLLDHLTKLLYALGYVGSRLRHCATSRNVLGSIPDGVIGIFHWHNPSSCTMALGSTQPLIEMSTRNISWWVKAVGAQRWQPYHLYVPTVLKSGSLNLLEPSGHVQTCNGIALPLPLYALVGSVLHDLPISCTLIMYDEQYKLWSVSCSVLQLAVHVWVNFTSHFEIQNLVARSNENCKRSYVVYCLFLQSQMKLAVFSSMMSVIVQWRWYGVHQNRSMEFWQATNWLTWWKISQKHWRWKI